MCKALIPQVAQKLPEYNIYHHLTCTYGHLLFTLMARDYARDYIVSNNSTIKFLGRGSLSCGYSMGLTSHAWASPNPRHANQRLKPPGRLPRRICSSISSKGPKRPPQNKSLLVLTAEIVEGASQPGAGCRARAKPTLTMLLL
jgi:hypothetical protein